MNTYLHKYFKGKKEIILQYCLVVPCLSTNNSKVTRQPSWNQYQFQINRILA